MQNHWLAATNFERNYDLILAIANLSLYYKSHIYDIKAIQFPETVLSAELTKVVTFLDQMRQALQALERDSDHIVIGTSSQFGEMILRYHEESKRISSSTNFYSVSMEHIIAILRTTNPNEYVEALNYINELRKLVDQSFNTSVNALLGDI